MPRSLRRSQLTDRNPRSSPEPASLPSDYKPSRIVPQIRPGHECESRSGNPESGKSGRRRPRVSRLPSDCGLFGKRWKFLSAPSLLAGVESGRIPGPREQKRPGLPRRLSSPRGSGQAGDATFTWHPGSRAGGGGHSPHPAPAPPAHSDARRYAEARAFLPRVRHRPRPSPAALCPSALFRPPALAPSVARSLQLPVPVYSWPLLLWPRVSLLCPPIGALEIPESASAWR
ncbi:uncharacterized protein LOC111719554 [Sarcophilus harrisii]|uniref:uncharacterized protein LOC111719554 n=1 Tax=Sarcophilus harrisii TaxID=9305 RepID=UPI001301F1FF|nr:uncharacterized protein LOC111719554 [Sarcophilus harrisii]